MGDMLYAPIGTGKPLRVQGSYVSDEEREEVVRFIKQNSEAQYSDDIIAQIEKSAAEADKKSGPAPEADKPAKSDYDELLPQAVDVILETKQASVSMLQRRLKLGYSRAARLVDQLEEKGIVVVACSQCLYEPSNFTIYEVGRKLLEAGVIPAGDMTTEAAVTKLMWALGQTEDPERVREIFSRNYTGEISE